MQPLGSSRTSSDALARPDADAEDAVAGFVEAQLGGEREHLAGAGGPEQMADRDRSAVGVQALVGDLEGVQLARKLTQVRDGDRRMVLDSDGPARPRRRPGRACGCG
jgi:hypothetical protein